MTRKDKAAAGRKLIREAICDVIRDAPEGLYNNQVARALDLESDYEGRQTNYLTYSVIGGLLEEGVLTKHKRGRLTVYKLAE